MSTKLFRNGALIGMIVALTVGSIAFAMGSASADTNSMCSVIAVGKKDTAGQPDSRFTLHSDGTVSASFVVSGNSSCQQGVTLASWEAPNPQKGRPYSEQKLFKSTGGTFGVGTHTLTVQLPNCFFQVDLARNSVPVGTKGHLMGSLHGGTQACTQPTPSPTPTPSTPASATSQQPTSLPNTGPGSDALVVASGATVLGIAFSYMRRLRSLRG